MKLYLIVMRSLSAGMKAAQACHAMHAFTQAHPAITAEWQRDNNIVVLEHDNIAERAEDLERRGYTLVRFHEPDLDDALTAICVEPAAWRHVSSLRLAA